MRRRRLHPDLAVVLLALVGVAALHVAANLTAPPLVALAEVPARAGARVAVEARVLDVTHGQRGRAITLAQDGARLLALAAEAAGPARGDVVRIVGVSDGVQLSGEEVTVLTPSATRPLDPSDVTRSPADYDGARILVRGTLQQGMLSGSGARISLAGDPAPASGTWLATGTFRYHANDASYKLTVDTWTRAS